MNLMAHIMRVIGVIGRGRRVGVAIRVSTRRQRWQRQARLVLAYVPARSRIIDTIVISLD